MKKVYVNGLACMLMCSLLLSSCKKEDERPITSTTSTGVTVEDNNKSMSESDDILSVSEADMTTNTAKMGRISGEGDISYVNSHRATVTLTPKGTNPTGTIVIDFGSTGIKSPIDTRVRKGKIVITYTDRYRVIGSTQTISLENYFVDGNKIEGTKVLTHSYENSVLITFIKETGGRITLTDNRIIEWNSERTRKWNFNNTLLNVSDDELTVTGSAVGKTREGVNFTALIEDTHPLLWKASCLSVSNYIAVSGIINVTSATGTKYTVNYGEGECDKEITVSTSGSITTIILNK